MSIRATTSTTLQLPNSAVDLKELIDILTAQVGVIPNSVVSFQSYSGDQREPGYTTITIRGRS